MAAGSDIVKISVRPSGFHPRVLPAALSCKVTLFMKLSAGFVEVILLSDDSISTYLFHCISSRL